MQRIRHLHQELARCQLRTAEENALSRHVFDAVTKRNPEFDAVRAWHSAVGRLSGDLLLFGRSPAGRLLLLFADFTGHGLSAALAAVPVSDLFYDLVGREVGLSDLVLALDRKLRRSLEGGRGSGGTDPGRRRTSPRRRRGPARCVRRGAHAGAPSQPARRLSAA